VNVQRQQLVVAILLALCMRGVARTEEKPKASGDPVAATVNGEAVYRSEVLRTLYATLKGRHESLDAAARGKLLARVLEEMIDQRLVYQFLKKSGKAADAKSVAAEIAAIGKQLEKRRREWPAHLKENGYTRTTFERQIEWRLSWQAYLEETMTDKLLEEYFASHLPQYDGGEVRASHILLRIENQSSGKELQKLVEKAGKIRREIKGGEITFAEAAKKYSHGPSRLRGGDIGYFPRHGVQGEEFSRAAFALAKKEISDPIVTEFGVHLIQTTDIRPGTRQWTEVRSELARDVTRELFEKIAKKQHVGAKIEYTGVIPGLE
jgi:parvulin-like peptidyl-prolyl isomerase